MNWIEITETTEYPPEYRMVLLQLEGDELTGQSPCVCVGYMKRMSIGPTFIRPGAPLGREVTHFCDSLGDDFTAPLWRMKQPKTCSCGCPRPGAGHHVMCAMDRDFRDNVEPGARFCLCSCHSDNPQWQALMKGRIEEAWKDRIEKGYD